MSLALPELPLGLFRNLYAAGAALRMRLRRWLVLARAFHLGSAPAPEHLPGIESVTRQRPPLVIWALPLSLGLLTIVAIVWSVFGHLDIVSTAQGQVVPAGHVKVVQAAESGVVQEILVHNGMAVEAGQMLIRLDRREAQMRVAQTRQQAMDARLDVARLTAALDGKRSFDIPEGADPASIRTQQQLLEASHLSLEAQLAGLDQEQRRLEATRRATDAGIARSKAILPLVRQRWEAKLTLLKKQIAPRTEVLQLEQEYVTQKQDLAVAVAQRAEIDAQISGLDDQRQQTIRTNRRDLLTQLAEAERRAVAAETERQAAAEGLERTEIRAPVAGLVHDLKVVTIGAVVQPGQELARVVPTDAVMEIEAKVANRDRAYVEVGQPVAVKFDAFEFTRYGAVSGRVVSISSDVLPDEKLGPVYQVRVALDSQSLRVDGREARFTPGMSASIDIRTGDRRAIDYLLEPALKASAEALRER